MLVIPGESVEGATSGSNLHSGGCPRLVGGSYGVVQECGARHVQQSVLTILLVKQHGGTQLNEAQIGPIFC